MDKHLLFKLAKDVITALYYAHKSKFYNCDLKPDNVFMDKDEHGNWTFYIGDWGGSV